MCRFFIQEHFKAWQRQLQCLGVYWCGGAGHGSDRPGHHGISASYRHHSLTDSGMAGNMDYLLSKPSKPSKKDYMYYQWRLKGNETSIADSNHLSISSRQLRIISIIYNYKITVGEKSGTASLLQALCLWHDIPVCQPVCQSTTAYATDDTSWNLITKSIIYLFSCLHVLISILCNYVYQQPYILYCKSILLESSWNDIEPILAIFFCINEKLMIKKHG